MATINSTRYGSICNGEEGTYECKGCLTIYCFCHLTDHREIINQWKEDSIKKIKQIAERYKQRLIHYTDKIYY
jgi:hypothetical protein